MCRFRGCLVAWAISGDVDEELDGFWRFVNAMMLNREVDFEMWNIGMLEKGNVTGARNEGRVME